MPRLCELYPGICLTTEEKAWKSLCDGSRREVSVAEESQGSRRKFSVAEEIQGSRREVRVAEEKSGWPKKSQGGRIQSG